MLNYYGLQHVKLNYVYNYFLNQSFLANITNYQ